MKSICNFFTILLFTLVFSVFPYFFKTEKINWGSDDGQTSRIWHATQIFFEKYIPGRAGGGTSNRVLYYYL